MSFKPEVGTVFTTDTLNPESDAWNTMISTRQFQRLGKVIMRTGGDPASERSRSNIPYVITDIDTHYEAVIVNQLMADGEYSESCERLKIPMEAFFELIATSKTSQAIGKMSKGFKWITKKPAALIIPEVSPLTPVFGNTLYFNY